jgi:hypothetical protein
MATVKAIKLGSTPLSFKGGVAEPGAETDIPVEIYEQYKVKFQLVGDEPKALDPEYQTKDIPTPKAKDEPEETKRTRVGKK